MIAAQKTPWQASKRWLPKYGIHSLRVRILLGFLLVSLTTLSIAAMGFWYQRQSAQLSRLRSLAEKVMLEVARMQQAEAEFNSIGVLQPHFYETGSDASLMQFQESYKRMLATLHQLKGTLPEVMPDDQRQVVQAHIGDMEGRATQMQTDMARYAQQMRERGFLNFGILGAMRSAAHALESSPQMAGMDLLQLRRHEKDYLLRRDLSYYEAARSLGQRLLHTAQRSGRSAEVALLQLYLSRFEALVSLERELGLIGDGGLRNRIAETSAALSRQVVALNEVLLQESLEKGDRYQRVFMLLALIAVVLTVLLSLYFSAQIIRPLRLLTGFIHREVEGQFRTAYTPLRMPGQHELSDLGADVDLMVQQIRGQLAEITAQGEALAARNGELQLLNQALKQTQEKQAALLRVREKVHSIISHDLRAPMNGMMAYLELMLADAQQFTPAQTEKFARQMLRNVQGLSEMMENLLRWSLFQSGELAYTPTWMALQDVVGRNIDLYADMAHKKSVTLVHGPLPDGEVHADAEMLDFTLRNLITNAIKFSPAGSTVSVQATVGEGGKASLQVHDQGVGMTAEQINRIMVLGEHVTTTGTQKEKGTGFGLMLCRDFVARQGGQLSIHSVVGEGTRVGFELPYAVKNAAPMQADA